MTDRSPPEALVLVRELTNTLDVETGEDALAAPGGVARFARRHGVEGLGGGEHKAAEELDGMRELREALRAACLAHTGTDMEPAASEALRRLLAEAPLTVDVDAAGRAELRPAKGLSGLPLLTARIAVGIATAEADGTWQRLKACEACDCLWVFYDRSPAGRGRWCSMAVCGSRAKMRTYRAKRR
ncbi:CGNR zinc finger domain-containing protein [Streptomyces marispadix]|uniref:CGNR zinc finger domain-containing protein n=1 Tax=Streptomyces marispadix TaxID=2922868 RepID=A0ABS9SWI7_9ACTN|nr:CGNR zinc finger domain-containing protein [Streptomyces marispadix]MCH6160640.1 CGNR zinc finger domain-containing protein [Streptomyces marispadix]